MAPSCSWAALQGTRFTRRRSACGRSKAWGCKPVPNPNPGPPQKIWIKDRVDALEPLTPHEARHCAASYMIAAGMDWKKITELIGHSDVRTTYNRYGEVVPEDLAPAAAQLEQSSTAHDAGEDGHATGPLALWPGRSSSIWR